MFKVKVSGVVAISGCPRNGLPAADWRAAHGLPAAPSNEVAVKWDGESESLCRQFPDWLDGAADLAVVAPSDQCNLGHRLKIYGFECPAEMLRPFAVGEAGPEDVRAVLVELRAAVARRAEAEAQKEAEAEARRKETAAAEAQRKTEAAAKLDKLRAWATEHGSELLRERIAGGFEWVSEAVDEWQDMAELRAEGGLESADEPPAGYDYEHREARRSPTLAEMRALADLRRRVEASGCPAVAVDLMRVKYAPETGADGYSDDRDPVYRTELHVEWEAPGGSRPNSYWLVPSE